MQSQVVKLEHAEREDEVDLLGKRGPQPGHGGRPRKRDNLLRAYWREQKAKQREKERLKNG
jgi:hypothetical protein